MQLQGNSSQPVIIQTGPIAAGAQPQLIQVIIKTVVLNFDRKKFIVIYNLFGSMKKSGFKQKKLSLY